MYVAVKGGEKAISAAHELLRREGRGDPSVPDLGIEQLIGQLRLAVDRVMAEGSLYDRDLAPTGPRFPGSAVRLPWTRQPCACCGAFPPRGRIFPAGRSLVRRSTIRTDCWIAPSPALKPEPPNLLLFQ